ncbi:hypothetical protein D9757_010181 [Collybiopsis confluens]|uniref:CBM21 domain-containing protein n=1 Tax=Collybiopsis confluens TaxID=2823264 RepID=A0A8H5LZ01_9AGAR|nr:hypothetical protein D9757_010181 [Collybiopsis confluens]
MPDASLSCREETRNEKETDRDRKRLWGSSSSRSANKGRSARAQTEVAMETDEFSRWLHSTDKRKGHEEGNSRSSSFPEESGHLVRIQRTGAGLTFARENRDRAYVNTRKELVIPHPVPRPESLRDALLGSVNILLEDIYLDTSPLQDENDTLALEGTFLVRNIVFEKNVFALFTMDGWATFHEVRGQWTGSRGKSHLASLAAPAFSSSGLGPGLHITRTLGDLIAAFPSFADPNKEDSSEWDRFTFKISVPPAVMTGPGCVVEFVGRFTVGNVGSEWWDN